MNINTIYKALSNPLRRDILSWLKEPALYFTETHMPLSNGVCVSQIHERSGVSKATMSSHLATLRSAGLVTSRRVGQWIFFRRNEEVVAAFVDELKQRL